MAIIQVGGLPDSGKTHFGLDAPARIHFIGLDTGFIDVLPKFKKHKDVVLHNIVSQLAVPLNSTKDDEQLKPKCIAAWNNVQNILEEAWADNQCRTITIDQETTLWRIRRHAEFGLEHVKASEYDVCNHDMDQIFQRAVVSDKHLICLTHLKERWISASATDGYKPDGYKYTIREVGISIQLGFEVLEAENGTKYIERSVTFDKCKPNITLLGTTITNLHDPETGALLCDYVNFASIMAEVYGGTADDYK